MINLFLPFQLACLDPIPNFLEEYENKYDPDESDDKNFAISALWDCYEQMMTVDLNDMVEHVKGVLENPDFHGYRWVQILLKNFATWWQ